MCTMAVMLPSNHQVIHLIALYLQSFSRSLYFVGCLSLKRRISCSGDTTHEWMRNCRMPDRYPADELTLDSVQPYLG